MNKLHESWADIESVALYGFGRTAKGSIDYFIDEFRVSAIIDNDEKFVSNDQSYRGIPIVNGDKFKGSEKIVILAAGKALLSIKSSLTANGKEEYIDYTDMDTFFEEWFWRFKHKVHLGKITTSVTTRCNFKCKYCSLLMSYYKDAHDYSCDMLCRDVDLLFSVADYISVFVIMGGEPFLYPDLKKYLQYVAEKYGAGREKTGKKCAIGNIQIITNGSILPSEEVLKVIQDYNIEIRLSDYTESISYKKRLAEFISRLREYNIRYVVFKQREWIDFGFPHDDVNMGDTAEELRQHMLSCHGMCQILHNGRYYYCSSAWSAEECGLYRLNSGNDYLELSELIAEKEDGKIKLLDYYKGNLPNGYVSFCKVCRGYASAEVVNGGV